MKRKNRIWLIAITAGILIVTGWIIMGNLFGVSNRGFKVYLSENDVLVISGKDIISYNGSSHEIRLNQEAIDRIKTLDLCRRPFVVKLHGREFYNGSFWSDIFSFPYSGIVITDILAVQNESTDTITIEPCYTSQFCEDVDL